MNKIKNIILCIIPLPVAIIIHIILTALVKGVIYLIKVIQGNTPEAGLFAFIQTEGLNNRLEPFVMMAGAAICILLFGSIYYKKELKKTGWNSLWGFHRLIPCSIILGCCLQLLLTFLLLYPVKSDLAAIADSRNYLGQAVKLYLPTLVFEVLFAPVSDELIFRGVVLRKCLKNMPFLWANLLQSLLFGIYHMNLFQGAYAFIFGLFLGYVMSRSKNIAAPIFLHMIINLSGNLINYLPVRIYVIPMEILILITVILILLAMGFISRLTKNVAKI